MTQATVKPADKSAAEMARAARAASRKLAVLSNDLRNEILEAVAKNHEAHTKEILAANAEDCAAAETLIKSGEMSQALFARLKVKESGVEEMAMRLREVMRLPDPLGKRLSATELDEGLILYKETCPLGVVAVVFESRPDVVPQISALALKSGNAVLLKGGAEAARTNELLVRLWHETLSQFSGVPEAAVQLLRSRSDVMELLSLQKDVDLLVPRGSQKFVETISRNSRIPVLGHGEGICHVYVDRAADLKKAVDIIVDAKAQYPAVCNAAETLLVHESIARDFLLKAAGALKEKNVELRGCSRTLEILGSTAVKPATDADWSTEYSDLILSIRIVDSLDSAIAHIHEFGSSHTESIVTEDSAAAQKFLNEVDAAGVYHNVSTRFADGYRYGLGSEVGISTSKLHARGPMGMEGLTTYKYKLVGNGHTVAMYGSNGRKFRHKPLA